jgi:ribonuclease HI
VLITPEGKVIEYALKFQFKVINNEAEYETVIVGLQLCKALEARRVSLKTDSQLVVNKIKGEYEARDVTMQKYLKKTQELISWFEVVHVERLSRSQNEQADALSKLGSSSMQNLNRPVLVEVKPVSSIHEDATSVFSIGNSDLPDWMKDLIQYKKMENFQQIQFLPEN